MNTTTQHVPGRLDHNRTILESGQSTSTGAVLSNTAPLGRRGWEMYGRGTLQQLPHREVKWGNHEGRGHEQHFKGALNYNVKNMWQSCWLPRTRSSDRLVCDATNRNRVALFERRHWAKRDEEANSSCSPCQRRIFITYSMRKGLVVMFCLSIQPHLHR